MIVFEAVPYKTRGGTMPNPSPHKARAARRSTRIRRAGDLSDVRLTLWKAIGAAEDVLTDESEKSDLRLRAVHAITQAAAAYAKLVEATEFEARLAALEKKAQQEEFL